MQDVWCHHSANHGSALVALAPYQGLSVEPESVNNNGVIVGYTDSAQQVHTAFIYSGGSLQNLNSFVPGSGWNLETAMGINNEGQIVGQGIDPSGNVRAYILTPTPEPQTLALMAIAGLAFLRRPRRRK